MMFRWTNKQPGMQKNFKKKAVYGGNEYGGSRH